MAIHESGENYLETILLLSNRNGVVRSVDIALELDYAKSSVSRAVNVLKEKEYINIDKDGLITFTQKGKEYADYIYQRHLVLKKFLTAIGVSENQAEEDACKMEHIISEEAFEAVKKYF